MISNEIIDYIHPELNKEIASVSGHYVLIKEARLPYKDRQLLYYIGHAAFETSCCGEGGCAYAFVSGFVNEWKVKKDVHGQHVSHIEKISAKSDREEISAILKEKEKVHQINFY